MTKQTIPSDNLAAPAEQEIAEVLERAADLITPEGAWSNDAVARDADGEGVFASSPDAVCWCALGAIWRVATEAGVSRFEVENPINELLGGSIAVFNDAPGRTQAEVVAKLREAAALARGGVA